LFFKSIPISLYSNSFNSFLIKSLILKTFLSIVFLRGFIEFKNSPYTGFNSDLALLDKSLNDLETSFLNKLNSEEVIVFPFNISDLIASRVFFSSFAVMFLPFLKVLINSDFRNLASFVKGFIISLN